MSLGRMEIAALKRMEKSLLPLKKKLEKLDEKILGLVDQRNVIDNQYSKMVDVMNTYTNGVPYEQILYPDRVENNVNVAETISDDVDTEATVDMIATSKEEIAEEATAESPWL